MANPTIPKVPITLDRERFLVMDLDALCKAEEVTGKNLMEGMLQGMSFKVVRGIAWACLLKDDPELTLARVGEIIMPAQVAEVVTAIRKAFLASFPDPPKNGGQPEGGPSPLDSELAASISSSSGASGA